MTNLPRKTRKKRDYTREIDGVTWIAAGEVAQRISRKPQQIKRWCTWWELTSEHVRDTIPHPLPEFRRDLDGYGGRYFREEDLPLLRKFRDQIVYGFFNRLDAEAWSIAKVSRTVEKPGDTQEEVDDNGAGPTDSRQLKN